MAVPNYNTTKTFYWLKVTAWYALAEACIQLSLFFILNNFGSQKLTLIELHLVMWAFQCVLIWPIWWVAAAAMRQPIIVQVFINTAFYLLYTYCWFGPIQQGIGFVYQQLQETTRPLHQQIEPILDSSSEYAYLNYQLLKHAFRLSWFLMAAYFYHFREEDKQRLALTVANKELGLNLLKWQLNPTFYFNTIRYLQSISARTPKLAEVPLLQLAKVMEYVIYETKLQLIEVKKELEFLQQYLHLINQQVSSNKIEMSCSGNFESLKIAPLLLVDLIEALYAAQTNRTDSSHQLIFNFNQTTMIITVNSEIVTNGVLSILSNEKLLQRLEELYAGRYRFEQSTLRIKLDDEP